MDNRIPPFRPDVVSLQTAQRPTPTPVRVRFSEVLAGGAQALVRGAQAAMRALPGAPLMAVAVRAGGSGTRTAMDVGIGGSAMTSALTVGPEGPGGVALSGGGTVGVGAATPGGLAVVGDGSSASPADGGLESSLAQSQAMNLYYLQIQEEVNAQSRTFTALSNVLEVEHNTAKSAIGNIH
jgi:hypothetical protein